MAKQALNELAIFGGEPAFDRKLHVGQPNIGNKERVLEKIGELLDRRWLTNDGPYVQELERRIADYLGVKHCLLMCNGTIAMEIAIRALDLTGEVIVPSFTFVATPHALQWQGITPVFADVAAGSHHLDPASVEKMITPRTTGILGVHVWGHAHEVEALEDIARRHNLRLMFDAAHAFACSYNGRMIGNLGEIETFSFHATKFFNTFEGGAATTNNDELAQKMRYMRNFGFAGYDNVEYVGTNGKMSEVSAVMGLNLLEEIDDVIGTNYRNYKVYQEMLGGIDGLRLFAHPEDARHNYQYIIVEVDENAATINRDTLVKLLHAENVLARRYFYPGCHLMEPYRSYSPHAWMLLPETNKLTQRVMSLPTGTGVNEAEIRRIGEILKFAVTNGDAITKRVSEPVSNDIA